jgi:hypothetical protein
MMTPLTSFQPTAHAFWFSHILPSSSTPDIPKALLHSPFVFVRSSPAHPPLAPTYKVPFRVLQRFPHSFRLQIGSRSDTVSIHRLKPSNVPQDVVPAQPPPSQTSPFLVLWSQGTVLKNVFLF